MPTKYSGKQVTRAGELLLKDNIDITEFESSMDVLSYWRFSYETPLTEAFEILKDITLKVDKTAIFAKRLKRYVSIVNKLKRFEDMKLRTIYDIGGCRAIVQNIRKLNKVVRELRKRPEFKNAAGKIKCKDYIKGVAIFAKDFSGLPARKISKNYATTNAFGCPDSSSSPRFDPTRGRNIGSK